MKYSESGRYQRRSHTISNSVSSHLTQAWYVFPLSRKLFVGREILDALAIVQHPTPYLIIDHRQVRRVVDG